MARAPVPVHDTLTPRWRGQRGRLEVWYATISDPEAKTGFWVHHEVVAPDDDEPYVHGWAAFFRADRTPIVERFGPDPANADDPADPRARTDLLPAPSGCTLSPPMVCGAKGRLAWDLRWSVAQPEYEPLFTFPSWAWERELLPASQVVCVPSSPFTGTIEVDGDKVALSAEARGNLAHIYGVGSAARWGWLHAELGGGDVLEVVSAVSKRPGLDRLRPLAFLQLRLGGRDWPRDPLVAAPLFRTDLGLPEWAVRGTVGRTRLRAEVTIPESRAVRLEYVDPDRATATCTNSEMADAHIVLERRRERWETVSSWTLDGTAHSEVGTRP